MPLNVTETRCANADTILDLLGRHRAACPRSGRLRTRAVSTERTLARVCREAEASVRVNGKLRADDERPSKSWLRDCPSTRGRNGGGHHTALSTHFSRSRPKAAHVDGAVLHGARVDKETKYAELLRAT